MIALSQVHSLTEVKHAKICVVTGGTDGIGKGIATRLAELGHFVIIVARNSRKGQNVVDMINQNCGENRAKFITADLSLLDQTHRAASQILTEFQRIDLLINNAGVFSPVRRETSEGFELTFALNYLSPVLFTLTLLPALKNSPAARIINITSVDHKLARINFKDLQTEKYILGTRAYGQSKLALMIFTRLLAEKLRHFGGGGNKITVNAVHPGIIKTKITMHTPGFEGWITKILAKLFGTPLEKSVDNVVGFALDGKYAADNGKYYSKNRVGRCSRRARNKKTAAKLWALTMDMIESRLGKKVFNNW